MENKKSIIKIKSQNYKNQESRDIIKIIYGVAQSKFGKCIIALKEDHVCYLSFFEGQYTDLAELQKLYSQEMLVRDDIIISQKAAQIFDNNNNPHEECKIALKGTAFQMKVWEHLVNIKRGSTRSYKQIAKSIGHPKAVRAVANAIANNRIAYLVPCHRVISKSGSLNKFKWGPERKQQMLRSEEAE